MYKERSCETSKLLRTECMCYAGMKSSTEQGKTNSTVPFMDLATVMITINVLADLHLGVVVLCVVIEEKW